MIFSGRPQRPVLVLVLSSCLLIATACGSTAPQTHTTQQSGGGAAASEQAASLDDGLTVEQGGSAAPSGGGGPSGQSGTQQRDPAAGVTSGAGGSGAGTATTGGAAADESGETPADGQRAPAGAGQGEGVFAPGSRGVTAKEIKIGLSYNADADEAAAATGSNTSGGDQRRYHEVMLDYVNGVGGVLGRKVVPAFYVGSANASQEQQSQEACAQWTQDEKVFAVVTSISHDVLRQCLANADTPGLNTYPLGSSDDRTFARFPLWVEAASLSLNRLGRVYPPGLAAQGFFKGQDMKLGLVYSDRPAFVRAVKSDLKPALRRLGVRVEEEATARIETYPDLGPGSSRMANIVLQFRSAGVTHVMFFEPWVGYAVFMQQAEGQNYRPRYGLNSFAIPQIIIETGIVPVEQFHNSRLVGWLTNFDVPAFKGTTPTLRLCNEIYRKAGVTFPDRNAKGIGLIVCDQHLQFRRAMQEAPHPVDGAAMIRGAERLDDLDLAGIGRGSLGPRKHYGVDRYRHAAFDDGCPCFRYTSGTKPMR